MTKGNAKGMSPVMSWKQVFRQAARAHIQSIRWRKKVGLPFDKRIEDLRFALSKRHNPL